MYVPRSVRRRKSLAQIVKLDPTGTTLLQHIGGNISTYMSGPGIKDLLKMAGSLNDPNKFRADLATLITTDITSKSKPKYTCFGNEIPQVLSIFGKYFTEEQLGLVVDHIINCADMFYPYARKKAANVIADLLKDGDKRAFSTLVAFLKVLENDSLVKILSKIEGGVNNPDVQTILSKTKVLAYINYDEAKVKSDPEVRRALIKEIANTSSIAKKIPFEVEVSLDDIKAIAPAARLSFLEFAFRPEIYTAKRLAKSAYWASKHSGDVSKSMEYARTRAKIGKLKMPKISLEKVKELLFSVSLQKNEEMNAWITGYSLYLDIMSGKVKPAKNNNYY